MFAWGLVGCLPLAEIWAGSRFPPAGRFSAWGLAEEPGLSPHSLELQLADHRPVIRGPQTPPGRRRLIRYRGSHNPCLLHLRGRTEREEQIHALAQDRVMVREIRQLAAGQPGNLS